MPAVLYAIPASHPCAAVERALQLKHIPYRRVELIPVAHKLFQQLRFHATSVPGLAFADGTKVAGSRAILRALEERAPEPALFPAADDARRLVERAEEWGDQVLQALVRRLLWAALRRAPGAVASYTEGAELPVPAPLARLSAPLLARVCQAANGATDRVVRADLIGLPTHLRRIDGWIGEGVLGGKTVNAADLQIASGLRLLTTVGDVEPLVGGRPAGALALRVFPDYPGAVPAGTLPAAWVSAARRAPSTRL